ncbi:MAG TPA: FkbM family methyltransferase [Verrucomicrobiae bacterium]|nr:FkbM family methyltransferase [Verrucomicrobiae bacterium]
MRRTRQSWQQWRRPRVLTQSERYDRQTVAVMERVLASDSCCLDIGAHQGSVLAEMARIAPQGGHIAFEPLPHLAAELRNTFPSVTVHAAAVGERGGTAEFIHVENEPAYSGLRERIYDRPDPALRRIQVQVVRIDDVIPETVRVAFIKLDIEGGEYHALRGALKTMRRTRPVVVFEAGAKSTGQYGVTPDQLFALFDEIPGYCLSTMQRWLKGGAALTVDAFRRAWEDGSDFYFIAYPEAWGGRKDPPVPFLEELRLRLRNTAIRTAVVLGFPRVLPFRYPFWELLWRHGGGRPNYLWGVMCAAGVARELGIPRISVIEFGVAGGNGLMHLERFAELVERVSGIGIDVHGFDSGVGLPKPQDHRDLPQLWRQGDFRMDVERLKARLRRARLWLGPVSDTAPQFLAANPAPVGFVAFDLDLYHSTMDAFAIFDGAPGHLLPRVTCYFDDIMAFSHGDFTGERLAIADFNRDHERRKMSPIYGLRHFLAVDQWWIDMMYLMHAFDHPRYGDFDGTNRLTELPLSQN